MLGARAVARLARDAELGDVGVGAPRRRQVEARARMRGVTSDAGVVPYGGARGLVRRWGNERREPRDPSLLSAQPDQRERLEPATRTARDPVDLHVVRTRGLLELHGLRARDASLLRGGGDLAEELSAARKESIAIAVVLDARVAEVAEHRSR